jgi:uncharacterized protein (TIGR03437 family)
MRYLLAGTCILLFGVPSAICQTAVTVVGPGTVAATFNGVPVSNAFQNPVALATGPTGVLYIVSNLPPGNVDGRLLQLLPGGALQLRSNVPFASHVATDVAGNIYTTSLLASCVSRNLTAFAGICHSGFGDPPRISTGDGGPALQARLRFPGALAADSRGNVFIVEDENRIRRVRPDGIIETVFAGTPAINIEHLAVGPDGQLYARAYNPRQVDSTAIWRLEGNQLMRVAPVPADSSSNAFAIDSDGNFYTDDRNQQGEPIAVRINRQGLRTPILTGTPFRGELAGFAFDRAGSLFIATSFVPGIVSGPPIGEARVWRAGGVGRALPPCTFAITPSSLPVQAAGGTFTLAVATDPSCAWTPRAGTQAVSELTIAPIGAPFLAGNGTVTVTVRANTGAARELELFIGETRFVIRQEAGMAGTGPQLPPGPVPPPAQPGCTFTLTPASLTLNSPNAATGTIRVTTRPDCRWAITVGVPWVTLTGEATRQGDSVVNFSVQANGENFVRSGVVTIGNTSFALVQTTFAPGNRPTTRAVVNGASFSGPIGPNSFATITGSAFSAGTTNWDNEVRDGVFPRELLGTRVRVNGLDTFPVFMSPTQINFLTPPNVFTGTLPVEVIYSNGQRTVPIVEYRPAAPGMFSLAVPGGNRRYPVAQFANSIALVAPEGTFPGVETRPAVPGDVIILYATGLGPTVTAPPFGRALTAPLAVADPREYVVQFGAGRTAPADYVGMIFAGLYQINVTVPPGGGTGEVDFALRYGALSTAGEGLKIALGEPQL